MRYHTYTFNDSRIEPEGLLPETIEALERYDHIYAADTLSYFEALNSSVWTHNQDNGDVFRGVRKVKSGTVLGRIGQTGDSADEAVIWHSAIGQSVVPRSTPEEMDEHAECQDGNGADSNSWNKLIFADFSYFLLKSAGVRDAKGDPLTVSILPSPSIDRRVKSTRHASALYQLATGIEDYCWAKRHKVLHLGGVSLGAAVSAEFARLNTDFDIESAFFGEVPNFKDRKLSELAKAYFTDGKEIDIRGSWTEDGPWPRSESRKDGEKSHMVRQLAGNGNIRTNLRLARELSTSGFESALSKLNNNLTPITLEYGDTSQVTEGFSDFVYTNEDCLELSRDGLLQVIRAESAPHIHSEHIVATADALLRSIKFAKVI